MPVSSTTTNTGKTQPGAGDALDQVARDPSHVNRQIAGFFRQWENAVPRLIILAAPTEPPYVMIRMLANATRGRMALDVLMTLRPGSAWTVMCRIGEARMQAIEPQLHAIISSFRTCETYGATNR